MNEAPASRITGPAGDPPWPFALAVGSTFAAVAAFVLQLAVITTLLCLIAATLVVRLDRPTGTLARRLIIRFGTDVTDDAERIERRPRLMMSLYAIFPIALAANAWQAANPDDQWNQLTAAITAAGCWVGWSFAEHGRAGGRPLRWFPAWLALTLAVGVFHTFGGPYHVRWAVCEGRLTHAVEQGLTPGRRLGDGPAGPLCWSDALVRKVNDEVRLYVDGGIGSDRGEGLAYSPTSAIEHAGGIRILRDLGDGWYWFETGSNLRSIWFDG